MKQYEHKSINAHCLSEVIRAGRDGWKAYQINGGVMYLSREIEQSEPINKQQNLNTKPTCFVCKHCPTSCQVKINHPNALPPEACLYNYSREFKWEKKER